MQKTRDSFSEKNDAWTTKPLGECATLIRKTISPSAVKDTPHIGLEHIGKETLSLLSHGFGRDVNSAKSQFSKGDILFGKLRPYFRKVIRAPFDGICSTDIWVVRSKDGIDQDYLFYCMASNAFVDFANAGSQGTRMPRATWEHAAQYPIFLPPLSEQRAIAHVLGTLDEKIELKRRMNETLEEMARALFKSWFVDFDPVRAKMEGRWRPGESLPGLPAHLYDLFPNRLVDGELGPIPEGWGIGCVEDLCDRIENGGTPIRKNLCYWGGSIPWFKTAELNDRPLLSSQETITREGLRRSACKVWDTGTVLIALYASPTVGRLGILEIPAAANQACSALIANPDYGFLFLYYSLFFARKWLHQIAVGAAQQNISLQIVKNHPIALPPGDIVKVFHDAIEPTYRQRVVSSGRSIVLAELREALLRKLLSGKYRLRDSAKPQTDIA